MKKKMILDIYNGLLMIFNLFWCYSIVYCFNTSVVTAINDYELAYRYMMPLFIIGFVINSANSILCNVFYFYDREKEIKKGEKESE